MVYVDGASDIGGVGEVLSLVVCGVWASFGGCQEDWIPACGSVAKVFLLLSGRTQTSFARPCGACIPACAGMTESFRAFGNSSLRGDDRAAGRGLERLMNDVRDGGGELLSRCLGGPD